MPSVSKRQRKFMQAAAHSADFAKRAGISQAVARDFATHDGTYADGGAVMLPNQFGALVTPRGGMADGGPVTRPDDGRTVLLEILKGALAEPADVPMIYDPSRAPRQLPPALQEEIRKLMQMGDETLAAPRVPRRRFGYGGDVDGSGGYGGDPDGDMGSPTDGRGVLGWGDPIDPATRERGIGFGRSSMAERGVLSTAMSVAGLGFGALPSIAEAIADWAESRGIPTDRDPVTGIAGGHNASRDPGAAGRGDSLDLGHFGPDVPLQGGPRAADAPGAISQQPGAALPPVPRAVLPALPALQQPLFDPTRYGYGPAIAWLR